MTLRPDGRVRYWVQAMLHAWVRESVSDSVSNSVSDRFRDWFRYWVYCWIDYALGRDCDATIVFAPEHAGDLQCVH